MIQLSADASVRAVQLLEVIAQFLGLMPKPSASPNEPEPDPLNMADVTFTIGTGGRDYSTFTAWEADLDNPGLYSAGDNAIGRPYNDSVFDESVIIDGGAGVGLASIVIEPPSSEQHDGTAGTGVRLVMSTTVPVNSIIYRNRPATYVVGLEVDGNNTVSSGNGGHACREGESPGNDSYGSFERLLVHNIRMLGYISAGIRSTADDPGTHWCLNNIVYDVLSPSGSDAIGIQHPNHARTAVVCNNTVHNVKTNSSTDPAICFYTNDLSSLTFRNNLGTDAFNSGSFGNGAAFGTTSFSSATATNNASDDATASGTGSLTNIVTADQYVSTVVGSEDLHLKAGSDCIDAGVDLGTSPAGVNIDINGRDRDAEGDVWDIGAHEFVGVIASTLGAMYYYQYLLAGATGV